MEYRSELDALTNVVNDTYRTIKNEIVENDKDTDYSLFRRHVEASKSTAQSLTLKEKLTCALTSWESRWTYGTLSYIFADVDELAKKYQALRCMNEKEGNVRLCGVPLPIQFGKEQIHVDRTLVNMDDYKLAEGLRTLQLDGWSGFARGFTFKEEFMLTMCRFFGLRGLTYTGGSHRHLASMLILGKSRVPGEEVNDIDLVYFSDQAEHPERAFIKAMSDYATLMFPRYYVELISNQSVERRRYWKYTLKFTPCRGGMVMMGVTPNVVEIEIGKIGVPVDDFICHSSLFHPDHLAMVEDCIRDDTPCHPLEIAGWMAMPDADDWHVISPLRVLHDCAYELYDVSAPITIHRHSKRIVCKRCQLMMPGTRKTINLSFDLCDSPSCHAKNYCADCCDMYAKEHKSNTMLCPIAHCFGKRLAFSLAKRIEKFFNRGKNIINLPPWFHESKFCDSVKYLCTRAFSRGYAPVFDDVRFTTGVIHQFEPHAPFQLMHLHGDCTSEKAILRMFIRTTGQSAGYEDYGAIKRYVGDYVYQSLVSAAWTGVSGLIR